MDTIISAQYRGVPLWIAILGLVVLYLESKRLFLLRRIEPADDSPRARGRALGQKVGICLRFGSFGVLVAMLCLDLPWVGVPLAVLLIYTSLQPALEFARGFAAGVAGSSRQEVPPVLVAMAAAAYVTLGRGALAFLTLVASIARSNVV